MRVTTRTRPRNSSKARNAEVARTLTNFSLSIGGDDYPKVHGEETMKFIRRINRYECLINFRGRVYAGVDVLESEARRRAFAVAADILRMLESDVITEFYGDYESSYSEA